MFVKPINEIPSCAACGTPMLLREKEGSKFWGCPNWRSCGGRTMKYTEPASKTPQKPYNKPTEAEIPVIKESPKDVIMVDLLNEINGKLDSMDKDIQIIINEIVPPQE